MRLDREKVKEQEGRGYQVAVRSWAKDANKSESGDYQNKRLPERYFFLFGKEKVKKQPGHQNDNCNLLYEELNFYGNRYNPNNLYDWQLNHGNKFLVQHQWKIPAKEKLQ